MKNLFLALVCVWFAGVNSVADADECENDDTTTDSYGDTCSSWYDLYPEDCGGYDDDNFSSVEQCCVCGGGSDECGDVPSDGMCEGEDLLYCNDGVLHQEICGDGVSYCTDLETGEEECWTNDECSYVASSGQHECINHGDFVSAVAGTCEDTGSVESGTCDGAVVRWCSEDAVYTLDCAEFGLSCGYVDYGDMRYADCAPVCDETYTPSCEMIDLGASYADFANVCEGGVETVYSCMTCTEEGGVVECSSWDDEIESPECGEDPNNDCVEDCAGVWGGDSVIDLCGVCDGETCFLGSGDVNLDQDVNVSDVVKIVSYIMQESDFSDQELTLADVISDGSVNVQDVVALVALIVPTDGDDI